MKSQAYLDLKKKQEKEFSEFPIAYAFNGKQLEEALEKLGAKDVSECTTVFNHGDIVKKENAPKLIALFERHNVEMHEALKDEDFAEGAFLYEMNNHEYAINWDGDDDVLGCFALSFEKLKEMGLEDAYRRARKEHMRLAHEEWEMI